MHNLILYMRCVTSILQTDDICNSGCAISKLKLHSAPFLSSLMKPDKPPFFTSLSAQAGLRACLPDYYGAAPEALPPRYPTESILQPAPQKQGFAPAQALKDAYLAHAAGCLLEHGHRLATTPSQPSAIETLRAATFTVSSASSACGSGWTRRWTSPIR